MEVPETTSLRRAHPQAAASPNPSWLENQEAEATTSEEAMFEKPLTPSDVGKLNRLVIPKQHAEKYFPIAASSASASDSGECKGLLLSFEDESGKCWRFRYSYWNSSQSYVLTKGWSRYVKDKRLDAGDVVSFLRHRSDSHRLLIRWRRRSPAAGATSAKAAGAPFYCAHPSSYPAHHQQLPYHPPPQQHEEAPLHAGSNQRARPMGNCSSRSSSSSSKVLRLFGVNMEYQTQQHHDHNNPGPSSTHEGAETNHDFYHNMVPQQPYYY